MSIVVLTGGNGFLGKEILQCLSQEAEVLTISRNGASGIVCDLGTQVPDLRGRQIDYYIHCAGKAHMVPKTESEKQAFYEVNEIGTTHLLEGIDASGTLPKAFVFISTVAVYGQSAGENITETHPLQGTDPYSDSKIRAELLLQKWCTAKNIPLTILRLPLIAGHQPPGNLGSMLKAITKGYYIRMGNGMARKSMVVARDVAAFIPKIWHTGGIFNLTDGVDPSFKEIEDAISQRFGLRPVKAISYGNAKLLARIGDFLSTITFNKFPFTSRTFEKVNQTLTFSDKKARAAGWNPQSVIDFIKKEI